VNILFAKFVDQYAYNEESGELTYRRSSVDKLPGEIATYRHRKGYLVVRFEDREYKAHRVIWLMKTGEEPDEVDHINHIRDDNRWSNLRNVSSREQQLNMSLHKNNKSGVQGVRQLASGRFNAFIMVNRKHINLGTFDSLEEAAAARKEAHKRYGFHANHGASLLKG